MKREVCPECGSPNLKKDIGYSCNVFTVILGYDCEDCGLHFKVPDSAIKCFDCRVPFTPKKDEWYCPECMNNVNKQHNSPEFYFKKSLAQWEQEEVDKGTMDQSDVVIE